MAFSGGYDRYDSIHEHRVFGRDMAIMGVPDDNKRLAVIIGGGPAGLMAAEVLLQGGVRVELYDAMPTVGRKFLVAGKGGLNFTHSEPYDLFLSRYGQRRDVLEPLINAFGPEALRQWMHDLGFETFVGSSRRVFPTDMGAGPILRAWLKRLKDAGLIVHGRHAWCGWGGGDALVFDTPHGQTLVSADVVVLALGGGSRKRLGSTGAWVPLLTQRHIPVTPFKPANCGFDVLWSDHIRERFDGQPVKPVSITFTTRQGRVFEQKGEFIVTRTGVQGSLIYALSSYLRDDIEAHQQAVIYLDLTPDVPRRRLIQRLSQPRGSRSMASHLARKTGLKGLKAALVWEYVTKEDFPDPERMALAIKNLPITLVAPRPLDEAISSAGGVVFEALDSNLMIRSMPGVFCAGEMLDWEAPTGGYLLTACFASGRAAGMGALSWLSGHPNGVDA